MTFNLLIFIIIIILLILLTKASSSSSPSDKDESGNNEQNILGKITCEYYIPMTDEPILILGKDFEKTANFDILIDGAKVNYSKEITFKSSGEHIIQYLIYDNIINMNYMFKDISQLISVVMTSDKNIKISSMISTFEHCMNLKVFTLEGYNINI